MRGGRGRGPGGVTPRGDRQGARGRGRGRRTPFLLACTDLTLTAQQLLEPDAARVSLARARRDRTGCFGVGDAQATTTCACCRVVRLSWVACCRGRLWRPHGHVETGLSERTNAPASDTRASFARLRRGRRGCVRTPWMCAQVPIRHGRCETPGSVQTTFSHGRLRGLMTNDANMVTPKFCGSKVHLYNRVVAP
mgnify:CR=1 FL=1